VVGAEPPLGTLGQRRRDRLAIRCDPTLAQIAGRRHRQHKFRRLVRLMIPEARSGGDGGLDDPILDNDAGTDQAAARSDRRNAVNVTPPENQERPADDLLVPGVLPLLPNLSVIH